MVKTYRPSFVHHIEIMPAGRRRLLTNNALTEMSKFWKAVLTPTLRATTIRHILCVHVEPGSDY